MNWNQTEGWIEKSFVEKKTVIRSPKIDTIFVPCVKYSFVTNGKLFSGNLRLYFYFFSNHNDSFFLKEIQFDLAKNYIFMRMKLKWISKNIQLALIYLYILIPIILAIVFWRKDLKFNQLTLYLD